MKVFSAVVLALVATANAATIKDKLKQFRDLDNIKKENLVKYLNDRHDKRMDKLEEMLEDRKTQLEHHNTGRRRLSPEDHERVSRQAVNYERKLKQLRNLDPDERADMMQHEADAFFRLNSVDYLDFPEL